MVKIFLSKPFSTKSPNFMNILICPQHLVSKIIIDHHNSNECISTLVYPYPMRKSSIITYIGLLALIGTGCASERVSSSEPVITDEMTAKYTAPNFNRHAEIASIDSQISMNKLSIQNHKNEITRLEMELLSLGNSTDATTYSKKSFLESQKFTHQSQIFNLESLVTHLETMKSHINSLKN
jgi:hypothetical protein